MTLLVGKKSAAGSEQVHNKQVLKRLDLENQWPEPHRGHDRVHLLQSLCRVRPQPPNENLRYVHVLLSRDHAHPPPGWPELKFGPPPEKHIVVSLK